MVSGGQDSRRVDQEEETSGGAPGKHRRIPGSGLRERCAAHTTKLRSRLLRCPSDMDKFLLCNPMRSADHESIAGPPKDSGKCGPGWPVCADLHLKVRLEGNFWRVGWC
ncbi:uncharacterized protein [Gorilla gorilla gorilla]|uniref:uncharacterized protein isoform X2 n=1 Tax=Gorilla gorilla gorilla TaxID=9595 RepID=UPI002445A5C1|nr:uncharacterized protein LOC129528518 isoform X2 [Gorilla gorilla gorilla]